MNHRMIKEVPCSLWETWSYAKPKRTDWALNPTLKTKVLHHWTLTRRRKPLQQQTSHYDKTMNTTSLPSPLYNISHGITAKIGTTFSMQTFTKIFWFWRCDHRQWLIWRRSHIWHWPHYRVNYRVDFRGFKYSQKTRNPENFVPAKSQNFFICKNSRHINPTKFKKI